MQGTADTGNNTSPGIHRDPESSYELISMESDRIDLRNDRIVGD